MAIDDKKYEEFKVSEFGNWNLFLLGNQYFLGRGYLWAKREDAFDFLDMTLKEMDEFFYAAREFRRVLREEFNPDLFNYYAAGNVSPHLHIHIIPRYKTSRVFDGVEFNDGIFGKNHSFYDRDFKTSEETLFKIRDTLKSRLK